MRLIVGACACFLWLTPLIALPAPNEDARIVLHAHPYDPLNTCTTSEDSLGLDCEGVRPAVSIQAGAAIDVYVYLLQFHGQPDRYLRAGTKQSRDSRLQSLRQCGEHGRSRLQSVHPPDGHQRRGQLEGRR